jgi:hypothetical protein
VDHPDFKAVRRAELLSRLAMLDELIAEQARRTNLVRLKSWDTLESEKQLRILGEARGHYVKLLRLLLTDDVVDDGPTGGSPASE